MTALAHASCAFWAAVAVCELAVLLRFAVREIAIEIDAFECE